VAEGAWKEGKRSRCMGVAVLEGGNTYLIAYTGCPV
jgi:hypothetical protein